MYNRILVPLDGSQAAQCSLEHVRTIARGCSVPEVVLLRVVEPSATNLKNADERDAKDYISGMVKHMMDEGFSIKGEVVSGKADEAIIDYARKNGVDFIIMSSHGRSGATRRDMGSVADRVIRISLVPVLLVPTLSCRISQGF